MVGVHAGYIDTDTAAKVAEPKISPYDVAAQRLDAVESGGMKFSSTASAGTSDQRSART
jgi:hypothetical protein